jgi:oxalate---CoA ligase
MIQQHIIEKVIVPNNKKKVPNTTVKCFRLVEDTPSPLLDGAVVVSDLEDDIEDSDLGWLFMIVWLLHRLTASTVAVQYGVKMNITVHKQIIDLLEGSGTRGLTLNVSISIYFEVLALIFIFYRSFLILCVILINALLSCF